MGMLTDGAVPTAKKIASVLRINPTDAGEIRALMAGHAWPVVNGCRYVDDTKEDRIESVLVACAKILGHGKVLAVHDNGFDDYYRESGLLHADASDVYSASVLYDTREDRFIVGSMGDYITDRADRFDEEACAV